MRYGLFFIFCGVAINLQAQDYSPFSTALHELDAKKDPAALQAYWTDFKHTSGVPFVFGDSVAFMYQGKANTVEWMGDFNAWGYDKSVNSKGVNIPNSDLWIWKTSFPKDARLDYKLLIDGTQWMIDPLNTSQQWSGVGGGSPNSELRMPEWKPDSIVATIPQAPRGNIESDIFISSAILGYQITYSVYTPPGYTVSQRCPIVYVLDGYEYMHERMGNMPTILNNLIYLKRIKPVVAVFIDQREPVNRSNNRRMKELAMNEKYLNFVVDELVPAVEKQHAVLTDKADRAVLGNSMGGLTAAYFAFSRPDVFGLAGVQSPAFWFRSSIFTMCDNPENPPVKIFMTTGVINDAQEGTRKMKGILEKNTCAYQYREVNQGHSWGNWRDLIDDILIYFFAAK